MSSFLRITVALAMGVALAGPASQALAADAAAPRATLGPFEIRDTTRGISSGAFPNLPNPFSRATVSELELLYKGKPISIKTGKGSYSGFYEAWFLEGAPVPAVLLALGGFYLVTEQAGQLSVAVLAPERDDIATLQGLDADAGQPLPERMVTVRDRRGEPRVLNMGSLLLLNHGVVLDLKTLRVHTVRAPLHTREASDFGVADTQATALSPGRTAYVLVGSQRGELPAGKLQHALVAVRFASDLVQIVPFEPLDMHIAPSWSENSSAWVNHYFQWTPATDAQERLSARPDAARLPWIGMLDQYSSTLLRYRLGPVTPAMGESFLTFLEREFGAQASGVRSDPGATFLMIEQEPFKLAMEAEGRSLVLAPLKGSPNATAIVRRIAARFNAELAKGMHQAGFDRGPPPK